MHVDSLQFILGPQGCAMSDCWDPAFIIVLEPLEFVQRHVSAQFKKALKTHVGSKRANTYTFTALDANKHLNPTP